jgi:hypothetical protein
MVIRVASQVADIATLEAAHNAVSGLKKIALMANGKLAG